MGQKLAIGDQEITSSGSPLLRGRGMKVAVGMSGGVDSSVAAALLVEQGYEVTGVFLECWRAPGCRVDEDRRDAMDVAVKLKIPFKVLDFKKEYKERVVDYFYREYEVGRTPNPDVMCNREIKFGLFYSWAIEEQGFDFVATGHYARVRSTRELSIINYQLSNKSQISNSNDNTNALLDSSPLFQNDRRFGYQLLRGVDEKKDQSYFLYQLRQEQLGHILFPIGGMTKKQVREEASKRGLPVANKPDSQGICFVGPVSMKEFLMDLGMREKRGGVFLKVKCQKVKVGESIAALQNDLLVEVGVHSGAWFYTIGQRIGWPKLETIDNKQETNKRRIYKKNFELAGLDRSNLPALYVVEKDVERNRLVVGRREELMRREFEVSDLHWVTPLSGVDAKLSLVRIRHGGQLVRAEVKSQKSKVNNTNQRLKVVLEEAVFGVAVGQACVLYAGEVCLGGGVIV